MVEGLYLKATGIGAGWLPKAQRTDSMTSLEVMSSIWKPPEVDALSNVAMFPVRISPRSV